MSPQALAKAKFALWLAVSLEGESLPKLSYRVIGLLASRYMSHDHDGVAWASVGAISADLRKPERHVRAALASLRTGGYLDAETRAGQTTHYRIASRFFAIDTAPQNGARYDDRTQPQNGADEASEQFDPCQNLSSPPDEICQGTPDKICPPNILYINPGYMNPGKGLRESDSGNPPRKARQRDDDPGFIRFYGAYHGKLYIDFSKVTGYTATAIPR